VVERANSLALYFICMTLAALMSLRDQWRSRQLRRTVQSLFTFLSGQRVHVMRIAWPLSAYNRCLEFFSSVQGDETILLLCCCLNNFSVAVTSIHCEP